MKIGVGTADPLDPIAPTRVFRTPLSPWVERGGEVFEGPVWAVWAVSQLLISLCRRPGDSGPCLQSCDSPHAQYLQYCNRRRARLPDPCPQIWSGKKTHWGSKC